MANNSPTIVAASLSDDQLKKSIDSLVTHVDEAMKKMVQSTNNAVGEMEAKLKSLGKLKIDSGGSADGGASKRAKAQNTETDAVQKNVAARDKQIKKNQEVATSFDQIAAAQQKAVSGGRMGIMETYNMQIELFKNLLREVRQDIDIFNAAIGSGKKTQIEWGQQGLKQANAEAEKLMRIITTLENQRGNLANVLAPQGHTIQNYVNSLQKANPELAQLNEQFKRGKSLLQQQKTEFEQNEQAQRNSTNQQKQSLDEMNAYIRQNIQREQERRDAIRQTGLAAQDAFTKIRQNAQIQLAENTNTPIKGIKELTDAITNMRGAYFDMSTADKESPIGQALKRDIENAQKLKIAIDAYNRTLTGMTVLGTKNNTNSSLGAYTELTNILKTLSDEYKRLGREERNATKGNDLADKIQRLSRATQKIQQQMNRPISFAAAMKGDEKTLDDIAYKMQRLRSYRQGIDLTKPNAANEIKQVDEALTKLQKDADKWMSKSQEMIKNNTALGRSWNYMKNRLAFYFTVGASTQFVKNLIEVRSQYEMNEKALGILLDSASRGTRIFNELSQMALVSPYTLIELSNAAKQLTAYDIAAKDVVDTTRRLADMASAVGVPVERLTYALGQIKAYGYLNSRDARMFANAGIPLVKQLADRYSELEGKMVSTADVYDRMKKKAIDYNDVMAVINKMTDEGGKFFDFQAKMAETLKVRLANLTLAWNNMLNDMGKDNQGIMTSGLKGLTIMFKHWRELYRIISTAITALGAYKVATMLAGMTTKTSIGGSAVASWISLARGIKSAKDATALFSLTLKSIPFTAWFTAIATLASYFILFNNSGDDVKQKLEDIKSAFDGVRKEVETLFADAIKTDNIGTQLTKLRDMLELAETELGVTIPIKLEDVNESNVRQKLKETKQFIDEYIYFSQTFSEAAAGTKFNELMNDFGSKARSTYTNVTESINAVKVALQELVDAGKASKRDIEILKELDNKPKDGESRIEYLQRLISLYEELGLIGQKKVTPKISFFGSSEDNIEELEQQQENALDRLGIKNKSVFENMLKDVQGYYSSSSIAAYQFEQQVMRVAEKIDINNIPVEQRTMKLTAAINEEASQNNWNQFEKEFARQIANEKFGTTIEISDESKKTAEEDLQAWQRNIQNWAKNNGITFDVSFQTNDTEASYAKRMLQEAKDAKELWETLGRKEKQGTGSKDATTKAYNDYIERRKLAAAAGADLSSLDAKSRKAASKAESELAKALKDELSTIDKVRSIYKDLTKEGMSHANAVERATRGWDETVNAINRVLQKNGLQKLDLSKFAGIENPRELVNMLQSQLNTLLKRGAKPAEIKELQTKVNTLEVDADKYDLTKITKGLNNELGKLKDEYELAVELDANPELGNMFTEMFGVDMSTFPKTIDEYMQRAQQEFENVRKKLNLSESINIFTANSEQWYKWGEAVGYSKEQVDDFKKSFDGSVGVAKKWAQDIVKQTQDLQYKLADNNGKIAIEEEKLAVLRQNLAQETNDKQKALLELQIQDQQNAINKLKEEILQLLPTYQRVFGEVAEHSAYMTRKLAKDYKNMLVEGKNRGLNADNTYSVRDPITGQIARISKDRMGKELKNADKELQKTDNVFKKIKESLTKGEDKIVDWVGGIENIGEAIGQVGDLVDTIGNIYDMFGNPNEYDATSEALHDIATTMQGVNTAAKGIGQIASGDYIGGAMSVISGLSSAIGAWFDNGDKEILQQIKDSERAVKRLELAYIDLEHAVQQSYGMETIGAQKAAIANKELQLVELKRQLALEKSRDSKDRDEDRIIELQKQIKELEYDIKDATDAIVNDLLGISSVGDALENVMGNIIDAFRSGSYKLKDIMKDVKISFNDMIANMVMKMYTTKILEPWFEEQWNAIQNDIEKRMPQREISKRKDGHLETERVTLSEWIADEKDLLERVKNGWGSAFYDINSDEEISRDEWIKQHEEMIKGAEKELYSSMTPTKEDILHYAELLRNGQPIVEENLKDVESFLRELGLLNDKKKTSLSALQQGIQGITEDTAGSLESYMNGVSQQVYYHSSLLEQIRDSVAGFDLDVSLGVQSQILLQLQSSYQVQMSIQGILEGVLNPSGMAFKVEMV
jgi:hypothetical protein